MIVAVCALPFHRWIFGPAIDALRAAGRQVFVVVHHPQHDHHWLDDAALRVGPDEPDYVLTADAPYPPVRARWPRAHVLAFRHSLAARGNTWEPMHAEADRIVTWSSWDEIEWGRRHVRARFLRAGCMWAAPLAGMPRRVSEQPRVTWAPSWNAHLSRRADVAAALGVLASRGWAVRIRPHAAIDWRERDEFRATIAPAGDVEWSSADVPAWVDIAASDVVVSDTSGFALLATVARHVGIVQIDPDPGNMRGAQVDTNGPEWRYRNLVGARVGVGDDIVEAVERAHVEDREVARRRALVAELLVGADPAHAPRRLVDALTARKR